MGRHLTDCGFAHPHPAARELAGRVTVVVPARDRVDQLQRCLESLGPGLPLCIVDDGSRSAGRIAALARAHQAKLIARRHSGGPAAARNAALRHVETELIAFLDSDCVAPAGWLQALIGHFDDPMLLALAPRIRPLPRRGRSLISRYLQARSPLDMGGRPARVMPHGSVAYLPSAALLVRREAVLAGFDEALRYGEDVDLVWRLCEQGRVRYEPSVHVLHSEPASLRAMLERRFRYGTSAAPLSRRHRQEIAPAILEPLPAAAALLILCGARKAAAGLAAQHLLATLSRARRLRLTPRLTLHLLVQAGLQQPSLSLSRYLRTLMLPLALRLLPARRASAILAAVAISALAERRACGSRIGAVQWVGLMLADELSYGAGVWWGCLRAGTIRPLLPALTRRAADNSVQRRPAAAQPLTR